MNLKKFIKENQSRIMIYSLIVIIGFILDRYTKILTINNLELNKYRQVEIIRGFLYFAYVENTGGAWSILSNATWLLALISISAVVGITYYLFKKKPNMHYFVSLCLIVSGGAGNLFDRVFYGAVVDFIETYPFGYNFPIFNVADIFVVCGSFYMIAYMIYEEYKTKNESKKKILTKQELKQKGDKNGRSN